MKIAEIHKMTDAELTAKLADLKGELMNLRFRHAAGQLDNPIAIRTTRKDIARVMGEIRARELKA